MTRAAIAVAMCLAIAACGDDGQRQKSAVSHERVSNVSPPPPAPPTAEFTSAVKAATVIACRERIRSELPGLEPTDDIPYPTVAGARLEVVQPVRITESFRAAPVGAIRCEREPDGSMTLSHVRR